VTLCRQFLGSGWTYSRLSSAVQLEVPHRGETWGRMANIQFYVWQWFCRPKSLLVGGQSTSLSVSLSRSWVWIKHLQSVGVLVDYSICNEMARGTGNLPDIVQFQVVISPCLVLCTSIRYHTFRSPKLTNYLLVNDASCHWWLTVKLFTGWSYRNGTRLLHCWHVFTQLLMLMYISAHQYHSTTSRNIPSLPRCLLSLCAASIAYLYISVLTNMFAGGSLVFSLLLVSSSETRYFVASSENCCIYFGVFASGCMRIPRYSLISFHLPWYSSASLNPTNGPYGLSLHLLSDPRSTRIPFMVASTVSSESSSSGASDTPTLAAAMRSHYDLHSAAR